jgi:hypothetical protein
VADFGLLSPECSVLRGSGSAVQALAFPITPITSDYVRFWRYLNGYVLVTLSRGAPYFFTVLLKTKALAPFRPLGHAAFALGSRRELLGSPRLSLGHPRV